MESRRWNLNRISAYYIINLIWDLFQANFYFCLFSLLFILQMIVFKLEVLLEMPWLLIPALTMEGPALAALLIIMDKMAKERETSLFTQYFQAYKLHFSSACKIFGLQIIAFMILCMDIHFFTSFSWGNYLILPFYTLLLMLTMSTFYALPILVTCHLTIKTTLKASVYYSLKNLPITLLIMAVIISLLSGVYYCLSTPVVSISAIFFLCSLIAYIIMMFEKDILADMNRISNIKN